MNPLQNTQFINKPAGVSGPTNKESGIKDADNLTLKFSSKDQVKKQLLSKLVIGKNAIKSFVESSTNKLTIGSGETLTTGEKAGVILGLPIILLSDAGSAILSKIIKELKVPDEIRKAEIGGLRVTDIVGSLGFVLFKAGMDTAYRTGEQISKNVDTKLNNKTPKTDEKSAPTVDSGIITPLNTSNDAEIKFSNRIKQFRENTQNGLNSKQEVLDKQTQFKKELSANKEISKEFKQNALKELEKFNPDLNIGEKKSLEDANKAFGTMMEMNNRSIEFYKFINELPKPTDEMKTKLPNTQQTIDQISGLQKKAAATMENKELSNVQKQESVFGDRGHLRMDKEQSFILSDLKKILLIGKTPDEQSKIIDGLEIIKTHLTHDLKEGHSYPDKEKVIEAYKLINAHSEKVGISKEPEVKLQESEVKVTASKPHVTPDVGKEIDNAFEVLDQLFKD
jgi:hypothetical protein